MSKTGMFRPYWSDLDGNELGPLRGRDVGEAHRLWREHEDIRLRVEPERLSAAEAFSAVGRGRLAPASSPSDRGPEQLALELD
jgi:hypothetical protein